MVVQNSEGMRRSSFGRGAAEMRAGRKVMRRRVLRVVKEGIVRVLVDRERM